MSQNQRASYICVPAGGSLRYLLPGIGLFVFLMGWFVLTDAKVINPNFLPGPDATAKALIGLFTDAPPNVPDEVHGGFRPVQPGWDTFIHAPGVQGIVASVHRIALSVFWACLIGIPLGIFMGAFGWFEGLFAALIPPMRNAPITAFLPLLILIFDVSEALKVYFLALGTLVYIIPTTFDAVRNVEQVTIDRAVDLGFKPLGALWFFAIPAALPRIFDGIRICTGIGWTYLVAAETVNATTGLGAVIANAGRIQNMPRVYASIVLILIMGVLTDYLFKLGQRISLLKPESGV